MQKVDLMESKSSGLRNAACSGPAYEPVTLATRVRIPAKAPSFSSKPNVVFKKNASIYPFVDKWQVNFGSKLGKLKDNAKFNKSSRQLVLEY